MSLRLTQPLLDESTVYQNAIKEYSINLDRVGLVDANISITDDIYSCINLQRNIIATLIVPSFNRLTTLLLSHNKLTMIKIKAPNLRNITLNHNLFNSIEDITIESTVLNNMTLHDTPLETVDHYRVLIIRKFSCLSVLDYQKVKKFEKESTVTIVPIIKPLEIKEDKVIVKLKAQLQNASTLEEIQQIEQLIIAHKSK